MKADPTAEFDSRFSDPAAGPTPWSDVAHVLEHAELYWLTTVRADGRPHVTPLIGVAEEARCTSAPGFASRRPAISNTARQVALTTGTNTWAQGLDVVVEGTAVRITDDDALQGLADAYEAKYGSAWHFDVGDGGFGTGEDTAAVFRIEPAKVLAFAKQPHGQTRYRFGEPA